MKTTLINSPSDSTEVTYPCIKKSIKYNLLALFSNKDFGVIIYDADEDDNVVGEVVSIPTDWVYCPGKHMIEFDS